MNQQQGPGYPPQGPGYTQQYNVNPGQSGYGYPTLAPPSNKPINQIALVAIGALGGMCLAGVVMSGKTTSNENASAATVAVRPASAREQPTTVAAPVAQTNSAPPATEAPAPAPTAATQRERLEFPIEVHRFRGLSELQQQQYATTFRGKSLHGSGAIFNVENCGVLDDSAQWGSDCIKVLVDTTTERAALYFPSSRRGEIAALNRGQSYTFDNCTTISIRNWGFWATATCDMP